jgi:hypothetical protein
VNALTLAVAGGALAGLGGLILVRELLPAAPPDLAQALARLDAPSPRAARPLADRDDAAGAGSSARWGYWLARHLAAPHGRLPVPSAELRLLRLPVEEFLVRKVALGLLGLALPPVCVAVLALVGVRLPIALPAFAAVVAGIVGFVVPDFAVRARARAARQAFRHAVGAYLDLVALERAADGGPAEALHRAAAVGQAWTFVRIQEALDRARLSGEPPWAPLARLAAEMGVDDLRDLADIIALAGDDGAAVYDTLLAKAAGLRARALSDAEAQANAASERMTLPAVLLGFGFLILVCYPGLARVLV